MTSPIEVNAGNLSDVTSKGATNIKQATDKVDKSGNGKSGDPKVDAALKKLTDGAKSKLDGVSRNMDTANTTGRNFETNDATNQTRVRAVATPSMQLGQTVGSLVTGLASTGLQTVSGAGPTLMNAGMGGMNMGGMSGVSAPAGTYPMSSAQLAALMAATEDGGNSSSNTTPGLPNTPGKGKLHDLISKIIAAKTPYAWGGGSLEGPTKGIHDGGTADSFGDYNKIGFDCSGLTRYLYNQENGVEIPRTSQAQYSASTTVSDPRPGDLVFPKSAGIPPTHVQMYIGDGKVVHAPQSGDYVKIDNLTPGSDIRRPNGSVAA